MSNFYKQYFHLKFQTSAAITLPVIKMCNGLKVIAVVHVLLDNQYSSQGELDNNSMKIITVV